MKTKVGDWVRVCFNHIPHTRPPLCGARLSFGLYQVMEITSGKFIFVDGLPFEVKSWVRCADMREGGL